MVCILLPGGEETTTTVLKVKTPRSLEKILTQQGGVATCRIFKITHVLGWTTEVLRLLISFSQQERDIDKGDTNLTDEKRDCIKTGQMMTLQCRAASNSRSAGNGRPPLWPP